MVGQWPAAGFALPGGGRPLDANKPVVIGDAFVNVRRDVPGSEARAAEMFLNTLGRIYPLLWQPEFKYYDWPARAKTSLRALTNTKSCCRKIDGRIYFRAYVACSEKPPESMVQGAIIVPLMEFETWQARPVPLLRKLRHVPTSFYHEELKTPVRWLPGVNFNKEDRSEEEHEFLMDSWYLMHTMLNLGRMAEMGQEPARKVFLDSLDTLIHAAHRFHYDWPVFYNQRNLSVVKKETRPGEGGEQDAAGLYVHVMLQAYNFTHGKKYLDEAEKSAQKLIGLSFGILYQTNNTTMVAVAFARLWRITGKTFYKDLSLVSVASVMSHLWLWHLGPDTKTFMALPPLHDAPYIAFYEEAEVLAALQMWQIIVDREVPEGVSLLIAEYQKHLVSRARHYYPSELPPELLMDKPKEGPIHPRLSVPLEGLGAPQEKVGTVGQAVYAAGAPFIMATRCWHRRPNTPFVLFCNYPVIKMEYEGTRRRGAVRLRIGGSPVLKCLLRLFPTGSSKTDFKLSSTGKGGTGWHEKGAEGWSAILPGRSELKITWDRAESILYTVSKTIKAQTSQIAEITGTESACLFNL